MQATRVNREDRKLDCRQQIFSTNSVAMKAGNQKNPLKLHTNHFKYLLKYALCYFPACIIWHLNNNGWCNKHQKREVNETKTN